MLPRDTSYKNPSLHQCEQQIPEDIESSSLAQSSAQQDGDLVTADSSQSTIGQGSSGQLPTRQKHISQKKRHFFWRLGREAMSGGQKKLAEKRYPRLDYYKSEDMSLKAKKQLVELSHRIGAEDPADHGLSTKQTPYQQIQVKKLEKVHRNTTEESPCPGCTASTSGEKLLVYHTCVGCCTLTDSTKERVLVTDKPNLGFTKKFSKPWQSVPNDENVDPEAVSSGFVSMKLCATVNAEITMDGGESGVSVAAHRKSKEPPSSHIKGRQFNEMSRKCADGFEHGSHSSHCKNGMEILKSQVMDEGMSPDLSAATSFPDVQFSYSPVFGDVGVPENKKNAPQKVVRMQSYEELAGAIDVTTDLNRNEVDNPDRAKSEGHALFLGENNEPTRPPMRDLDTNHENEEQGKEIQDDGNVESVNEIQNIIADHQQTKDQVSVTKAALTSRMESTLSAKHHTKVSVGLSMNGTLDGNNVAESEGCSDLQNPGKEQRFSLKSSASKSLNMGHGDGAFHLVHEAFRLQGKQDDVQGSKYGIAKMNFDRDHEQEDASHNADTRKVVGKDVRNGGCGICGEVRVKEFRDQSTSTDDITHAIRDKPSLAADTDANTMSERTAGFNKSGVECVAGLQEAFEQTKTTRMGSMDYKSQRNCEDEQTKQKNLQE